MHTHTHTYIHTYIHKYINICMYAQNTRIFNTYTYRKLFLPKLPKNTRTHTHMYIEMYPCIYMHIPRRLKDACTLVLVWPHGHSSVCVHTYLHVL